MSATEHMSVRAVDSLRDRAIKRLKAKSEFQNFLWVWLGVTVIVNVVWFSSGAQSYYWPIWPMLGLGIGAFFMALNAYGPAARGMTEERIEAEMVRLARR